MLKSTKYFSNQIGFEPSKAFVSISSMSNKIINDYYDPNKEYSFIKNCDAFVSRQVFEHITNPLEILTSVYKYLNYGAVGLIEVPNGLKIIEKSRYYEVFNDHLNYYTPHSLSKLITNSGYELLSIETLFNNDYLIGVFRKPMPVIDYFKSIDTSKSILTLINLIKPNKRLGIFGMGAKGQQIFSLLNNEIDIQKIFDNDIHKIGLYPPNSDILIEIPSIASINEVDVILITALTYKNEIINQLKNEFSFKGDFVLWEEI